MLGSFFFQWRVSKSIPFLTIFGDIILSETLSPHPGSTNSLLTNLLDSNPSITFITSKYHLSKRLPIWWAEMQAPNSQVPGWPSVGRAPGIRDPGRGLHWRGCLDVALSGLNQGSWLCYILFPVSKSSSLNCYAFCKYHQFLLVPWKNWEAQIYNNSNSLSIAHAA